MSRSQRKYAAFLRGINVGGHKKVPMAALQAMFMKLGFGSVRTLLASGNVVFEASEANVPELTKKIEKQLAATFGFPVAVIVRTVSQLQELARSEPFDGVRASPATHLYVTFLSEKPKSTLNVPWESPNGGFRILRVTGTEVCSVAQRSPGRSSVEAMAILENEFGKNVTTRNWNTVEKILR